MNVKLTFGEWLNDRLDERGWRQRDLVERLGTSESTVSAWVNGDKRPTRRSLRAVADALDIPRDDAYVAAGYAPQERPVPTPRERPQLRIVGSNDAAQSGDRFIQVISMAARHHDKLSSSMKAAMVAGIMAELASEDWDEAEFDDE